MPDGHYSTSFITLVLLIGLITSLTRAVSAIPFVPGSDPAIDLQAATAKFSFRSWVDDLHNNPEDALSPEEAVKAFYAARRSIDALRPRYRSNPVRRERRFQWAEKRENLWNTTCYNRKGDARVMVGATGNLLTSKTWTQTDNMASENRNNQQIEDAVAVINQLAGMGNKICRVDVVPQIWTSSGTAEILSSKSATWIVESHW